jgi:hypothetical protein
MIRARHHWSRTAIGISACTARTAEYAPSADWMQKSRAAPVLAVSVRHLVQPHEFGSGATVVNSLRFLASHAD